LLAEVEFDDKKELMSRVYESIYMKYKPEFDAFAFEEQCDDLLHASILAYFSSLPSLSCEALPSIPSSSSLELKCFPTCLNMHSWV